MVCEQDDILYSLAYGTILGAFRHEGLSHGIQM